MLWALAQPAAIAGLVAAYVLGVALRVAGASVASRVLGLRATPTRAGVEPLAVLAATLSGTGWGRPSPVSYSWRVLVAIAAGPVTVLATSQLAFAAYHAAYPHNGLTLRLNRPSDVLHGAVAPTHAAQLMISVAVGLLCFGLLALVPVPPLDGYRLIIGYGTTARPVPCRPRLVEQLGLVAVLLLLVVPVAGHPPLLAVLDVVGGPLVRVWA